MYARIYRIDLVITNRTSYAKQEVNSAFRSDDAALYDRLQAPPPPQPAPPTDTSPSDKPLLLQPPLQSAYDEQLYISEMFAFINRPH